MKTFKVISTERLSSKTGDKLVKLYLSDVTTGAIKEVLKNAKKPYVDYVAGDYIAEIAVEEVKNPDGTIKLNAGTKYVKADSTEVNLALAARIRSTVGEGALAVAALKSVTTTTVGRVDQPIPVGEEDVLAAFK